ncbi:MAG: penicillin-binding protein 1C [Rhizonema sp. NSF051]|nr:penicillin-binding protein 1C [Rhizonema sp. NSF051]
MKQALLWSIQIKQKWHHWNCRSGKVILALLLVCVTVRLLPYLAPIHVADITQEQQAIAFTDRNGLPLGTLLTRDQEHTAVVPLKQVSPQFIHAILAAEDGTFYKHGALDLKAIARAFQEAIHKRKIVSGASTITMQLARMLNPSRRTLLGKVQEIWLSWRLSAGMNKDEIFSAYINRLPMGGNIYGVEAASRTYFSISASDLNLSQASLLAALPNNPTYFDPYLHYPRLKKRQKYVLRRMLFDKHITSAEAERAYAEQISFQSRQQGIIAAPHFLFWLASQQRTPPRKRGGEMSSNSIRTTIDRSLQQFVEAQVQQVVSTLATNNVHDAAALVIDNHSGEVLAYVGSPDYFDEAKLGRNDGVQALRQPGSTLKPFLYEFALEKDIIFPNSILADVPAHYAIPGAKLYSPTDYNQSFLGPVRVRVALANSLNVPAVRVLEKVGVQNFLDRLHDLGFEHLTHPAQYYGLGLTLGSGEVSLWELARAYLYIARLAEATPLLTTFPHSPLPTPVEAYHSASLQLPTTWELITDMLSDRHARATAFGVDSVLNLPFPSAVKTGTSSHFRDTWTVGFTTDYTVATWVGNFDGTPMRQVSGVTGAAPLWNRIMLHLHEHQEPVGFSPPEGMQKLPICATSGLPPSPDCSSVVEEYFYQKDLKKYEHLQKNDESLAAPSHFSTGIKILSPHNRDLFLLYPGGEANQRLEFKLAGTSQPVEWWLNGEKLATQSSHSLFWQLHPGNWTLEVRTGETRLHVNFKVQLGTFKPKNRGFSIGNT